MLKQIIDKLEDVEEKYRGLYKKGADEKYHLQIDGDDREALLAAKEHEKKEAAKLREELKQLNAKNKDATTAAEQAEIDRLKKEGDVAALEASWKKKLDDAVAAKDAEIAVLTKSMKTTSEDAVAMKLANEMSDSPALLAPFLQKRLQMELSDGKVITRVLDAEGKPSALSLDDLKKEFSTDDTYKAIITGTKASGSGASDADKGGSQTGHKKLVWADYNSSELVTLKNEDKAKYDLLKKTQGQPKTQTSV